MGDIGPEQQHYEVLPTRTTRDEPQRQPEPARPVEAADADRTSARLSRRH